jgi:hypothetical protein
MKVRILLKVSAFILFIPALLSPNIKVEAVSWKSLPAFNDFAATVSNGQAGVVRGVYVPGVMAYKVIQQSTGDPGYVSPIDGVVTQFSMAIPYGVIGLLAHDNLAGVNFPNLQPGQEVKIIYGDGKVSLYTVSRINQYQAIASHSTLSNFTDLNSGTIYTAAQIFKMYYQGGDQVIFQTCIAKEGNLSWGRLFILATPGVPFQTLTPTKNIPQYLMLYK